MKHGKILSLLSAVVLGLSAAVVPVTLPYAPGSITAEAASLWETDDGYLVSQYSSGIKIEGYQGTMSQSNYVIQSEYDGYEVLKIVDGAFRNQKMTGIQIPSTVKIIGESAFSGCNKLTKAEILGACTIGNYAFYNCSKLQNIIMDQNCTRANSYTGEPQARGCNVFTGCTSLTKINNKPVLRHSQDLHPAPYLEFNTDVRKIIKTFFVRSQDVKFINDYCTDICYYLRDTLTRDWMSEAVKARQYHDWIETHCRLEDENGTGMSQETAIDPENQLYSSVFLSYALNIRGEEIGESTCLGLAKAYQMLLTASGITSYVVYQDAYKDKNNPANNEPGHAWNLVKLDNHYYQSDLFVDIGLRYRYNNVTCGNGLCYRMFVASNSETGSNNPNQKKIHNPQTSVFETNGPSYAHPLENYTYSSSLNNRLNQCTISGSTYDPNRDGILDGDWSLNGVANMGDNTYYYAACDWFNSTSLSQDYMWAYLYWLDYYDSSPDEIRDRYI